MLKYLNDSRCPGNGFYTYSAFITASRSFNRFGTTGDLTTRKRELAAFLAQTSMKQKEDGQVHQMAYMHGDIAL
ncbi:hypothetical protein Gorai_019000 [Gossypium raimondii]|uniref:Glycoside hydrolase family 19 catalytic domain-containing protein n=1 Tax=Gossypium raimondii TaxID=29730 RepID=A0A7J8PLY6_GOSRA|nr:hypothetical protein [Gossypium raimondii]